MLSAVIRAVRNGGRVSAVAIYAVVNALPGVTNSLLAVYYALVLTLPEFGAYGILLSVIALINIVVDLGLSTAIIRQYSRHRADAIEAVSFLSSLFSGGRLLSLAALAVVGAILYVACSFVGFAPRFILPILAIGFFDRSIQALSAIFRAREEPVYAALGLTVQAVVTLAMGFLLVGVMRLGLAGAVAALVAGRLVGAASYVLAASRMKLLSSAIRWRYVRDGAALGLPLVPGRLAAWARQVAIRPVLSLYVPLSSVGAFMVGATLSAIPQLISSAIDLALAPIYFRRREDDGHENFHPRIVDFGAVLTATLFPAWVALIVFAPTIANVFLKGRVPMAGSVIAILMVASFARYVQPTLNRQMLFLNLTAALPFLAVPAALLAIAPTILLAGKFGILAAALAAAGSEIVLVMGMIALISRYEPIDFPLALAGGVLGVLTALAAWVSAGEPLPQGWNGMVCNLAIVSVSGLLSLWLVLWPRRRFVAQLLRS